MALVTGASSGLGRASAIALAADGWTVALVARRADLLEEVAARIRREGGEAAIFPRDIVPHGAAAAIVAEVVNQFGRLDLLLNNAGVGYCAPLREMPEEATRAMIELNFTAPVLMSRAALPHLKATRGVLMTISSGSGMLPSPYYAVYGATKAALLSLAGSIRIEEHGAGIGVVTICPGPVMTGFQAASGGAPVHADRIGVRIETEGEIARLVVRHARRPGRVVPTSLSTRTGWVIGRFVPRFTEWLVRNTWARKVGPEVEEHFRRKTG